MNKASIHPLARDHRSPGTGEQIYAVGIGANRPMAGMRPRDIVRAAFDALDLAPLRLVRASPIIDSRPLGPSARTYANAAVIVSTTLPPLAMLDQLQAIERTFHRRRYRRWGPRTLDLDLLLWSGGNVRSKRLTVPHPAIADRAFVLEPLCAIAPNAEDPVSGLTIHHLASRLRKPKPAR
ncbi:MULTISPECIES: 2-amino-4-hydroxy-6-hydroxymethyldihydropteridine diphosphokinase [unclassified Sphingobium]|uniref:2-amino-4-hydroxy-6- hydroxymethyldihydropteridine diphosphokinase n=1 Tax=unclassified Sphingobium TaxID=2611147 RepID=UPI002225413C|nr:MULTISPECIES: 2-amino-4-hydroxy-6-hydroxymethyldihydropteridine diphosphokinase [unclassified Sphingobium]MCW2382175.1 2-amino-4-hydroxy-6-hydroxymethyldihydropteridine diphosphokinase [Sphingobium sp. B2D3B]MCW2397652.1 2-amino-4-hydroxy-6-hydroxymethyldihydropteridine diphosphokinase [Sphingobium sp. B2D3C]